MDAGDGEGVYEGDAGGEGESLLGVGCHVFYFLSIF